MNFKFQISNFKFSLIIFFLVFSLNAEEWKTYTNTNFINDIIEDSSFLYCATNGGFTVFSRTEKKFTDIYTNVDGLPTNRINCLILDKLGKIWIGTYRGMAIYNPTAKEIQKYDRFNEITQNVITCLDRAGDTILVGTQNGLFVINTNGTSSFADDNIIMPNLPSSCSDRIFSLKSGNDFWIGACPGVIKLNRNLQTYTTYLHPFGDSVKAMTVVSDTLYLATEKGILRYNRIGFDTILSFQQSYSVFDIQYDDKFYIATNAGLISYDWQNLNFIYSEDTRVILISNGLWLGIGGLSWFGGGLRHYYNSNWQSYRSSGLVSNNVSCVVSDKNGTIYAMHYPTQTYPFRAISYKKINENWQLLYDTIIDNYIATVDKNNYIWFGHWLLNGGLSRYDPNTDEWNIKHWNGYRGVIGALGIDGNNIKWTYNQYNTIIALDAVGNEIEFSVPGLSRPEQGGYEFAFDTQNRVWLGSSGGLVMLDYNNTITDQSDDTYRIFPYQEITSVAVDMRDRVWCTTTSGIILFKDSSFSIFDTTKVTRVKSDLWGNIWFLTINSLLKYNIYTKEWGSYNSENSRIIPNVENDDKFFRWLFIDDHRGFLLISTKEGISQFFYKIVAPESLSEIRIYPNPFIARDHQVITFESLPTNAVIKIYTIDGKFVTELTPNINFAGVRWQPNLLKSGIYLVLIRAGDNTQIAKFAVIR